MFTRLIPDRSAGQGFKYVYHAHQEDDALNPRDCACPAPRRAPAPCPGACPRPRLPPPASSPFAAPAARPRRGEKRGGDVRVEEEGVCMYMYAEEMHAPRCTRRGAGAAERRAWLGAQPRCCTTP